MYQSKRSYPQISVTSLIAVFILLLILPITILAANSAPTITSLNPASGTIQTNQAKTFATVFGDANGWQNIQYVYFLINTTTSYTKCFYGYYNQNTNKFYIRNDTNSAWVGGFAPGSAYTIQNSYATLNCKLSTVTGSGNSITINWNITFKDTFASNSSKYAYLYIRDDSNSYVNWTKRGAFTVDSLPTIGEVTPTTGLLNAPGGNLSINSKFIESHGYQYLSNLYVQLGSSRCYAYYNRSANKLYLINDAGATFTGGFAPGSTNIIENSHVKLDCLKTTVSGSGTTMIVNWSFSLKEPLATTTYPIKLYGISTGGLNSGWITKGEFCIARQPAVPAQQQ